jgi:nucleoside-diphosphate-sugar epimerase
MEEVLVIGGAGFLGRSLVRMLREAGSSIRILSRSAGVGSKPEPGIRYVRGEVADADAIAAAIDGCDVVYDLSLGQRDSREDMERHYVQATVNLARACQRSGVRRVIYTSTTAALELGREGVIRESDGTDPRAEDRPGFYHLGKIKAERILFDLHAKEGLPAVVLRPAIIMGRGGRLIHSGIGTWRDSNRCLVVRRGDHPLPFVLVDDVARAFFLAKDAPGIEGRAFNLVGDVRPSAREMVGYIRERSMRDFRIYSQSIYTMYAVAVVKSMMKRLVGKPDDSPTWHAIKFERLIANVDCSETKRMLNWKPVDDLETFLREAVDPHLRPVRPGDLRLEKALA